MADQVRSVTVELAVKPQGSLAAPFAAMRDEAKATKGAISQMAEQGGQQFMRMTDGTTRLTRDLNRLAEAGGQSVVRLNDGTTRVVRDMGLMSSGIASGMRRIGTDGAAAVGSLGAMQGEIRKSGDVAKIATQATQQSVSAMAIGVSQGIGRFDEGIQSLSGGLNTITTQLLLAGGSLGSLDQRWRGVAEMATKAGIALLGVHTTFQLLKGAAAILGAMTAGMGRYAASAAAAAAANTALAQSQAQVAASTAAGMVSSPHAGQAAAAVIQDRQVIESLRAEMAANARSRQLIGFAGAGVGAFGGAVGGQLAAQQMGWGPGATMAAEVGGAVAGGALGSWGAKRFAPMLGRGLSAVGGAASSLFGGAAGWLGGIGAAGLGIGAAVGSAAGFGLDALTGGRLFSKPYEWITGEKAETFRPGDFSFRYRQSVGAYQDAWKSEKTTDRMEKQRAARIQLDELAERRLAVEQPFIERNRMLTEGATDMRSAAMLEQQRVIIANRQRPIARAEGAADAAALLGGSPIMNRDPGGATRSRQTIEAAQDLYEANSAKALDAAKAVDVAENQRLRTVEEYSKIQDRLNAAMGDQRTTLSEMRSIQDQLAAAGDRKLQAEEKTAAALQNQGKVLADNLRAQKQFVTSQKSTYQGALEREQDNQKTLAERYGAMTQSERMQTLQTAKKLEEGIANGPGAGRPDQIRLVNGKPTRIPGSGTDLSQEELGFAQSNPFLREMSSKFLQKRAEQDPGFQEFLKVSGSLAREQEAKQQIEVHTKLEQAIQAKIEISEESVAEQLTKQLIPQITSTVTQLMEQTKAALNAEMAKQTRAWGGKI